MTDKEIIRKMIKEQAEHYRCVCKHSEANALLDLLSIIDSRQEPVPEVVNEPIMVDAAESLGISQKEYEKIVDECIFGKEEPVSDDLEKAIKEASEKERLHKAKNGSPFFMPTDFASGFNAGALWKEKQMMKNAVDGVVHHYGDDEIVAIHYNDPKGVPMSYFVSSKGLNAGEKVKLITVKED